MGWSSQVSQAPSQRNETGQTLYQFETAPRSQSVTAQLNQLRRIWINFWCNLSIKKNPNYQTKKKKKILWGEPLTQDSTALKCSLASPIHSTPSRQKLQNQLQGQLPAKPLLSHPAMECRAGGCDLLLLQAVRLSWLMFISSSTTPCLNALKMYLAAQNY